MKSHIQSLKLSRRQFVVGSGGIAIGVAFGLPAFTASKRALAQNAGFAPNQWVSIAADGTVTILSPAAEIGHIKTRFQFGEGHGLLPVVWRAKCGSATARSRANSSTAAGPSFSAIASRIGYPELTLR